jgi:glycine hydroxymethyltransferase
LPILEQPPILPAIPWRVAMLERRKWVPAASENYVQMMAQRTAQLDGAGALQEIDRLVKENRRIHDLECINLNPATNVMNPKAEALLSAGLGSRPSLGYPGNKYEMGLEAIEQIEVIAAELAAERPGGSGRRRGLARGRLSRPECAARRVCRGASLESLQSLRAT